MRRIEGSLTTFLENEKRKIICFGGGNYFRAFVEECEAGNRAEDIIGIADNFIKEKEVRFGERTFCVSDIQGLKEKIRKEKLCIVITTAYYKEVEEQLCEEKELKDTDYYVYPLMQLYEPVKEIKIAGIEKELRIPEVIHYCWFGHGEKSEKEKQYIAGWKEKCPGFQIIEWNEDNYDVTKCKYAYEAYKRGKWAFVSDYARIDILYQHGGFYFDTDVEIIKDITPLRYHKGFVGVEAAGGVATGLGCGFEKGFFLLKEIMEKYENSEFVDAKGKEILKVNANFETDIFRRYGYKKKNDMQIIGGAAVYPPEFFSPLIVGTDRMMITENTYSIHHYHYSWKK